MKNQRDLLNVRICDLNLEVKRTPLLSRINGLYAELKSRQLRFRPPCYFADEWFVPEGDPVIGIPFYLANRTLTALEKHHVGAAEGDTKVEFMKLLRHEAGHAICYAFKLNQLKTYRSTFGPSSKRFFDHYRFDPRSKEFVINLADHYAQSHPDEDFAETFAIWLSQSRRSWQKTYKTWGALKKLEVMSQLMDNIKNKIPLVRTGEQMCHVSTLHSTLATYYKRRRIHQKNHSSEHEK